MLFGENHAVEIDTRPATAGDSDFCLDLHRRAMGALIAEIFGTWDTQVQEEFHRRWFDPTHVTIIETAETPIGMLDIRAEPDHVYLSRVEVLPRVPEPRYR